MGRVEDGMPYRWGQLYGALVAMRSLAGTGRIASVPATLVTAAADNPYNVCRGLLRDVGHQLLAARERGGAAADAAAVIMDDIARSIPPRRESKNNVTPQAAVFAQGYEDRFAAYRKAWESLTG
ncbi:hypothetical protein [Streptomyces sp. NPDC004435]|uniref:hypothetical protein n=1 Tax=Streptomyces sp. NPDC004435 TaxID=3364701 RepID=UPI00369FB613